MIRDDGSGYLPGVDAADDHRAEVEARLDGLVAALPGIAFRRVMDRDGTIRYPWFSDAVTATLGFEPAAMGVNAKGCLHVIHWADRDAHVAAIRASADSLHPCIEEFRAITADGEVRWLKGTSRPRRSGDGVEWDGVLIDVTDGRRAEHRLDTLMEHAGDAIFILDDGGAIDIVNAAAERLFGYGAAELVDQPVTLLLAEYLRRPALLTPAEPGGEGGIVGCGPRELEGLRKDGSTFPLELSTVEVRIEGHRLFVGIGRDVTQRKRTEAALRDTEQRLRAIAANLPGMVFQRILRVTGRLEYSYVSEGCRNVLGLAPQDLVDDPHLFLEALSEEERQRFLAALGRSARTMEPLEEEMAVFDAHDHRRWLRGLSRPTLRETGDVVWDGVLLDVTDRKVAEQRLSFLAYFDPLTRLPNRAAFIERFAVAAEAARQSHTLLGVLSLGIDRFGVVNATMGHAIGDQVLMAAADVLQAAMGPADVMARASGDRFLILVTGVTSPARPAGRGGAAAHLAQTTVTVAGEQFDLSASIGLAGLSPRRRGH